MLTRVTWDSSTDEPEDTYVCHFRHLCVQHFKGPHPSGISKYWLIERGEDNKAHPVSLEVKEAFNRCFGPAFFSHLPSIYAKPVQADLKRIRWFKGHTLGSIKREGGTHPVAWLNIWSRVLSLAINVPSLFVSYGVKRDNFFDQVVVSCSGINDSS